jgi:hypothetical protein
LQLTIILLLYFQAGNRNQAHSLKWFRLNMQANALYIGYHQYAYKSKGESDCCQSIELVLLAPASSSPPCFLCLLPLLYIVSYVRFSPPFTSFCLLRLG